MALSKSFFELPDELLVEIKKKLKLGNPEYEQDLLNLSLASKQFNRIVHPDRRLWLMTKVLPCLFPYIRKEDALNLRLVSSDWRDATDKFLGDQWNLQAFNSGKGQVSLKPRSPKYTPILMKGLKDEVRFERVAQLVDFLEKTEKHKKDGRNPVLSRSMAFSPTIPVGRHWGSWEMTQYWDVAVEIMRTFGTHIHYLLVGNDSFQPSTEYFHGVLHRILPLCPNLRSLEVTGKTFEYGNRFQLGRKLAIMAENPLPPLPYLEYLDSSLKMVLIKGRHKSPQIISSPINEVLYLTYGQLVKRLGLFPRDLQWICKEHRELPRLTELNLGVNGLSIEQFKESLSLPSVGKLTLSGTLQLNELFELLGMFPVLKVLEVGHLIPSDAEEDGGGHFVVPVSTLSVNFTSGMNYSFLSKFPFLKYIHFTWDMGKIEEESIAPGEEGKAADKEDLFKLSECVVAGTLSKCPVWEHLQKLKEIHVTVVMVTGHVTRKVYKRERFEYLKELEAGN